MGIFLVISNDILGAFDYRISGHKVNVKIQVSKANSKH